MITREFILDLIRLLKPQFYNKITWSVVGAGLAMMGTPFLEAIVSAVLEREFNLDLAPGGNTGWGYALVSLGLIYNVVTNALPQYLNAAALKDQQKDSRDHDVKIFDGSQAILPEESLMNFFDWLLSDHSFTSKDSIVLHKYAVYHEAPQSKFLDLEIQDAAAQIATNLTELLNWMSVNFWTYPRNQGSRNNTRFCMHPHWNIDRGGNPEQENFEKYDDATKKLRAKSDAVTKSYETYRGCVKRKLFV